MTEPFASLLGRVAAGQTLDRAQMTAAMEHLVSGAAAEGEIALFLSAVAARGETAEEVAGAARALRAHMTPIRHRYARLLDTCGTGGGGSNLFNVSTAAALVIAAAGVPVAKHGNRSVTSRSGSADVLAALGVNIEANVAAVERSLDQLGICFCFAPLAHPAMRHVSAVRKRLGTRTIFNVLGPLANPAGATHQLLGAGVPGIRPLLAAALGQLDVERALVVSGADGLGEATLADVTHATEVARGGQRELVLTPEQFGLPRSGLDALRVDGPEASAAIIRSVYAGAAGPARDIVVLNAAAGLMTMDADLEPARAAAQADEALRSGAAADLLRRLVELSHGRG